MRHVSYLYHSATRMFEVGLYSFQVRRRERKLRFRSPLRQFRTPHDRVKKGPGAIPLLVHYHIFKNAGTSFEWTLQQNLGAGLHLYDSPKPDSVLLPEELLDYVARHPHARAISSHQTLLPPPLLAGREVIASILLRDPVARIRSIYAFEKQQSPSTPGAVKAKELEFKDYIEWRLAHSPGMLCNHQVRFCARTPQKPHPQILNLSDLQRAIENLHALQIVGTAERYNEWLALAETILRRFFPRLLLLVAHKNATNTPHQPNHATMLQQLVTELGPELAERLVQCNHLDFCLHQAASSLLTQRLTERNVRVPALRK